MCVFHNVIISWAALKSVLAQSRRECDWPAQRLPIYAHIFPSTRRSFWSMPGVVEMMGAGRRAVWRRILGALPALKFPGCVGRVVVWATVERRLEWNGMGEGLVAGFFFCWLHGFFAQLG